MNCSGVERWLDQGMPENGGDRAMRHVALCGACFEAYEAAAALEKALRAEAAAGWAVPAGWTPAPGPGFTENVMARVAASDSLAREARLTRRRAAPWISVATDPLTVSSITAALVVAAWTTRHPSWMVDAGVSLAARWWSTAEAASTAGANADPLLVLGVAIAVAPLVVWGAWTLYRRFERAVLLLTSRPGV